jgi:hypothetical protein
MIADRQAELSATAGRDGKAKVTERRGWKVSGGAENLWTGLPLGGVCEREKLGLRIGDRLIGYFWSRIGRACFLTSKTILS